jgi:hypothetical protein
MNCTGNLVGQHPYETLNPKPSTQIYSFFNTCLVAIAVVVAIVVVAIATVAVAIVVAIATVAIAIVVVAIATVVVVVAIATIAATPTTTATATAPDHLGYGVEDPTCGARFEAARGANTTRNLTTGEEVEAKRDGSTASEGRRRRTTTTTRGNVADDLCRNMSRMFCTFDS